MTAPVVRLQGARKSYRMGSNVVAALRGVDFQLGPREMTALVGPSGSGKTTLLNIIGCLDVLDDGTFQLSGRDMIAKDFDALATVRSREIGFIFQTFNLVPVLSVAENVELSLICRGGWSRPDRKARIAELLEAVGLERFAKHRPDELSGGQRQRVAIARALAPRPSLVLADEPTANLDSDTAESILQLLVALNRDAGVTILFSTHDARVMSHARRCVQLRDGQIVGDGPGGGAAALAHG